jgi:hypothetical protein
VFDYDMQYVDILLVLTPAFNFMQVMQCIHTCKQWWFVMVCGGLWFVVVVFAVNRCLQYCHNYNLMSIYVFLRLYVRFFSFTTVPL